MTIQEAGVTILTGCPRPFYIFTGTEYGIKLKYIKTLSEHYGKIVEADTVASLMKSFRIKQLIKQPPSVYVVRYDSDFINDMDAKTVDTIKNAKINGTVVCIYESDKHASKCEKFLPEYTVNISRVDDKFVAKYLKEDFKNDDISSGMIDFAVRNSQNYYDASLMCESLRNIAGDDFNKCSESDLHSIFGIVNQSSDDKFREAILMKHYTYALDVIESYSGDLNSLIYVILSAMIDMEHALSGGNAKKDIGYHRNNWNIESVHGMFYQTYSMLEKLRSSSAVTVKEALIYLVSLLPYDVITRSLT